MTYLLDTNIIIQKLFKNLLIIDINSSKILQRYAEIDAYSQNRLTDNAYLSSKHG
jgi:hypothetical protein